MLYLYRSNLIENLSIFLSANLKLNPLSDPLAKEYVVVGSRGMEQWLKRRLSEDMGIVSNVEFPFPTAHLGETLEKLTATQDDACDEESSRAWSPDALMWSIVNALPELIHDENFQPLLDYLGTDPERSTEIISDGNQLAESMRKHITRKELGLCRQIADLFDRYITYRPDWAVQWSQGKTGRSPTMPAQHEYPWQPLLWKSVEEQLGDKQAHIATRLTRLGTSAPEDAVAQLGYSRLSIFGTPSIPKSYLQILAELAKLIDVHLYILCPSDKYWGDLKNSREKAKQHLSDRVAFSGALREEMPDGNPLLLSLGRVARDFQTLLLDLDPKDLTSDPDTLKGYHQEVDVFVDPLEAEEHREATSAGACPSALAHLQSDIFKLAHPKKALEETERELVLNDDSIQIHSCHSPTRQVEVLKEALFHLLDRHTHLQPRDIVVMTPDIETYATLIRAIFDEGKESQSTKTSWGPVGGPRLPYQLADLSLRRLNPVADALMRVLELATARVEATAVLDLLALEPVQRCFNIEPDDLTTIQTWLDETGIRWGINAKHRQEDHEQPQDVTNTWQFGLEKLALGVTMANEDTFVTSTDPSFDDPRTQRLVTPFDDIEGSKTELLGNFLAFTTALFSHIETMQKPCSIDTWVERLKAAITDLTLTPQKASFLTRRVRDVIDALESDAKRAECSIPVSLSALKNYLDGRFEVEATRQKQSGGAITFGGLLAVRSIPYKVVVLLGMDDGTFPRSPTMPRFDLTSHKPRVGDRDPRDEDRLLLLEAILSAREHLMVFYSGRNVRSNAKQEPATPIAELFDVINQSYSHESQSPVEWMTTQHPLQPFSPENFLAQPTMASEAIDGDKPGKKPWSFNQNHFEAASSILSTPQRRPDFFKTSDTTTLEVSMEIDLERFTKTILQPVRSLFKNKDGLNLNLDDYSSLLDDREPINLDSLEGWKIAEKLIEQSQDATHSASQATLLEQTRADGTLPLGTPGRLVFNERYEAVQAGVKKFKAITENKTLCDPLALDLELQHDKASTRLKGQLTNCWDQSLVYLYNGKDKPKRRLVPWIAYLAATAQDPDAIEDAHIILCYWDDKTSEPVTKHFIMKLKGDDRQQQAQSILKQMFDWYLKAQKQPIPLVENTSHEFGSYFHTIFKASDFQGSYPELDEKQEDKMKKGMNKTSKKWKQEGFGGQGDSGEGTDPHLALVWPEDAPFSPSDPKHKVDCDFAWHALSLWQPLYNATQEQKAKKKK